MRSDGMTMESYDEQWFKRLMGGREMMIEIWMLHLIDEWVGGIAML